MRTSRRLLLWGWMLVLAGGLLAHWIQTAGGTRIEDVRFTGINGKSMSGLLYIPPNATASTPAPAILAVHGYINTREMQSGFAIEYARRGYVVLALDQTGHGHSEGPAFSDGYGGPAGLKYLRSLDIVDANNIGLEGHSMGGGSILFTARRCKIPAQLGGRLQQVRRVQPADVGCATSRRRHRQSQAAQSIRCG
jgi:cephalosporin-C deacetylase-like acetyl esterase